jgi:ubiquinone/menaquinone biosynthesis C-methylase UbiE
MKTDAVPVLEEVPCNLCGGTDLETVYDARADLEKDRSLARKFRASGDELLTQPLVRCRQCELLFVSPRVSADRMLQGYAEGPDPEYVSQMASREKTFARAFEEIDRLVPQPGYLLDVGTAAGAFLKAARDRGWDAVGVEPNAWLAEWGRNEYGVSIRTGTIDDVSFPDELFDVVTMWDVIEHTPDPSQTLGRIHRLLKPNGVLIVNYPDIGSSIARFMGRRWPFLSSVHLYYFTRETMSEMLRRAGFVPVNLRSHIQRLQLEYIAERASVVSPTLSRLGVRVIRTLRLGRLEMPYWLGQTFVAARRKAILGALSFPLLDLAALVG